MDGTYERERVKGVEPGGNLQNFREKQQTPTTDGAKAALTLLPSMPADDDLQQIVNAWRDLPDAIRAGILAMARSAK